MFPFFLSGNELGLLRKRILFLIVGLCLWAHPDLLAQTSLERERQVPTAGQDSIIILDPWIIPETFRVYADTVLLDDDQWTLHPTRGKWSWDVPESERIRYDTLHLRYDYWPIDLPADIFERELVTIDTTDKQYDPDGTVQVARRALRQQELFADTRLQRSGSLRRGFVAGTNQDLSLESGLNFEISGHITDDVEVVASLTDRSTPIQPDGTTQTLR